MNEKCMLCDTVFVKIGDNINFKYVCACGVS